MRLRFALFALMVGVWHKCFSSPLGHQSALGFANSLRLTRTIRARVQQLLIRYKEEQFGDSSFEDRRLVINTLPTVTVNYHTWRKMQDTERLYKASRDLYKFWTHLESQRKKLEQDYAKESNEDRQREREAQRRNKRGRPQLTLPQSILGIQLDVRDLIKQVTSQLTILEQQATTINTQTPPPTTVFSSPTESTPVLQPLPSSTESHNQATSSSVTESTTFLDPTPTSSPTLDVSSTEFGTKVMSTSTHSGLGLISSSTPWDLNTSQTVSSSTEIGSQSSKDKLPQEGEPTPLHTTPVSGPSRWVSRLEGYVILRDLERYLSKIARDYTLLRSKY